MTVLGPAALIGVGTMGRHFARHLVAGGVDLTVYDASAAACGTAAEVGAQVAASAPDAVAGAGVVFLSLPTPPVVESVAAEIAPAIAPGSLLIDCSTSPPALARSLAAALAPREVAVLDAPVSGGPVGAEAATLTVMVGGESGAYERGEPYLRLIGSYVVHVGPHGAGQVAKLCNNLLAGVNMAALCQALSVARAEGLDPVALFELVSRSTGDSRVLRARYPAPGVDDRHPSNHDFAPLFALDLIAKDLDLALELVRAHELPDEPLVGALDRYRAAQAQGLGPLDYSALIRTTNPG